MNGRRDLNWPTCSATAAYKGDNVCADDARRRQIDDLRYKRLKKAILNVNCGWILADRQEGDTVLAAFAGHGLHFRGDKNSYQFAPPTPSWMTVLRAALPHVTFTPSSEKCKAGVEGTRWWTPAATTRSTTRRAAAQVGGSESVDAVGRANTRVRQARRRSSSCSLENEKAYESGQALKHGVFFHFVIEGLKRRGVAADGGRRGRCWGRAVLVTQKVGDYVRRGATRRAQKPEAAAGRSSGAVSAAWP